MEEQGVAPPRYARMTKQVEALIAGIAGTYLAGTYLAGTYLAGTYLAGTYLAGTYLAGTNTRRVRRALAALFRGLSARTRFARVWRKVKTVGRAWLKRRARRRKTSSG